MAPPQMAPVTVPAVTEAGGEMGHRIFATFSWIFLGGSLNISCTRNSGQKWQYSNLVDDYKVFLEQFLEATVQPNPSIQNLPREWM